jgi:hypothetical protein
VEISAFDPCVWIVCMAIAFHAVTSSAETKPAEAAKNDVKTMRCSACPKVTLPVIGRSFMCPLFVTDEFVRGRTAFGG